jgi:hypothetical protein
MTSSSQLLRGWLGVMSIFYCRIQSQKNKQQECEVTDSCMPITQRAHTVDAARATLHSCFKEAL